MMIKSGALGKMGTFYLFYFVCVVYMFVKTVWDLL